MVLKIKTDPQDIDNAIKIILGGIPGKGVEDALRGISTKVKNIIQGKSPVGIGDTSGNFKKSWSGLQKIGGGVSFKTASYAWTNLKSYGAILEEGTYPGIGPRTITSGQGIYSKQAVGGVLQPLVDNNSFVDFIVGSIADKIVEQLGREHA